MSDDETTIAILRARNEIIQAELDAVVNALDWLEKLVDGKAHMWPDEQAAVRTARAVLIEHGRRKAEVKTYWEDRT